MSPADPAHRLANPYAQAAHPDGPGRPVRVAGRALAVGALGLGAVTVFTGTGLAADEPFAPEDTTSEVATDRDGVPRENGVPGGEVSGEFVEGDDPRWSPEEEVVCSWGEPGTGPPSDPDWLFTTPVPCDDPSTGGWSPGVVDEGGDGVPREGDVFAEDISEEVPVADGSHWGPEVEVPAEPTDPDGQPDPRPLQDRLEQWQDRLEQWQDRSSADRDGGPLAGPDGPIGVPVGSDAEIAPVLPVDGATAGDSSDDTTGPAVMGWPVSPRYTWEQIEYMRATGIPFQRLAGSDVPPRSQGKDDRPRILGGAVTGEALPEAPSGTGSDAVSAV